MKRMKAALLFALSLSLLGGCSAGGGEDKTDTAKADNGERTKLTVGFDAEFPPYGYKDESSEYTGFDLELAQAVADKEGWELVKQPIDWDAKDMELSSGAIDCIWNGFTMTGREDDYTFSDPYIDNSQVWVVKSDSGINSPEDLAGKTIGVQKDSSALAALQDDENQALTDSFANLTQYGDYNMAFMDLEAGAIDALALDIGVADYQLESRGDAYKMLDDRLASEKYAIGFAKGNTELKDQVQKDLYELYDEGKVQELAEKYGLTEYLCLEEYKK